MVEPNTQKDSDLWPWDAAWEAAPIAIIPTQLRPHLRKHWCHLIKPNCGLLLCPATPPQPAASVCAICSASGALLSLWRPSFAFRALRSRKWASPASSFSWIWMCLCILSLWLLFSTLDLETKVTFSIILAQNWRPINVRVQWTQRTLAPPLRKSKPCVHTTLLRIPLKQRLLSAVWITQRELDTVGRFNFL